VYKVEVTAWFVLVRIIRGSRRYSANVDHGDPKKSCKVLREASIVEGCIESVSHEGNVMNCEIFVP
jgi:hypothetical protein